MQKFNENIINYMTLSDIETWREIPKNHMNNLTELNHMFMKSAIFLVLSLISEDGYKKKVNYKNFHDILFGYSKIRFLLKDINIKLLKHMKAEDIIEYLKLKNNLNDNDKKYIKNYYKDSFEKTLWNISSSIANLMDYESFKMYLKETQEYNTIQLIENNFKKWEKQTNKNKYLQDMQGFMKIAKDMKPIYKFFYRTTFQKRWNGYAFNKKLSIGEHQILVLLSYFTYKEQIEKKELNSGEIKINSLNLLFHDLVEGFTKDINSPVKNIGNIRQILEQLEEEVLEEEFFSYFPPKIANYLKNKIDILHPFEKDKRLKEGVIEKKLGKKMDDYTAYLEALYNSVLGNKLDYIQKACQGLINKYKNNSEMLQIISNLNKTLKIDLKFDIPLNNENIYQLN